MCTIHANSAHDALTKICTLPLLAGENISRNFVVPTVASCFDLVVHCTRDRGGRRYVEGILAVGSRVEDGVIESSTVFHRRDGQLVMNPSAMVDNPKLEARGLDIRTLVGAR